MSDTLEHLGRQQRTLTSIRGIVRTMKTLAAINVTPYEQAASSIEADQRSIRQGFAAFAFRMGTQGLPALPPAERALLVAFGSDHGFCGNYNAMVARTVASAPAFSAGKSRPGPQVLCVGARLHDALIEAGIVPLQRFNPPASVDGISRLAGQLVSRIEQLSHDLGLAGLEVMLACTRRAEHGSRVARLDTLLPVAPSLFKAPRRWPGRALPGFSMAPAPMLSALLRNHIFASVFRAAAEALVTENAARLALMQQAEQTVEERLDRLRLQLASLRQDAITDELMDIVAGHIEFS